MIDYLGVWFAKWLTRSFTICAALAFVVWVTGQLLALLEMWGLIVLACGGLFAGYGHAQPWIRENG